MKKKILLGLVFVLFFTKNSEAQQDSIANNTLFFRIENLNFVKNNEYFNHIADGYTLLGSQLHPKLTFYPYSKAKLELGVFALKYAGLVGYHKVLPTFSFSYTNKNSVFVMGTLDSQDKHHVIDPLLGFESVLDERSIENGLQYQYSNSKIGFDAWLNWEKFIFKKDTHNEEFVMGLSFEYDILRKKDWTIKLPIQNLFYHRGGQINTNEIDDRTVFTMRHTALGLKLGKQFNEDKKLKAESYFIQHQSNREPEEFVFETGFAWYTHIDFFYKSFSFGLGHWYGDRFVSPKGDAMFQSVSSKTDIYYVDGVLQEIYANHTDPIRSLILGQLSYNKSLFQGLDFGLKTNLFYQNYYSNPTLNVPENAIKNHLDYSIGLYVKYKGKYRIY